jgi:protein RecA
MDERYQKLVDFAAACKKTYGHDMVMLADQMVVLDIARLGIGSVAFDYALGGGLPRGRVMCLWGAKSSGKTTHAKKLAGQMQRMCRRCWRPAQEMEVLPMEWADDPPPGAPTHRADAYCDCVAEGLWEPVRRTVVDGNGKEKPESDTSFAAYCAALKENSYEEAVVFWLDVEGAFDKDWAVKNNVDIRRLWISRPEYAEQGIDIADSMLQTGACDLLVIDSLAMLVPSDEREESTEKWQQGLQARLLNKAVRKWVGTINDVANATGMTPSILWIQQEREKIGVTFGSNKVRPGGRGQDFATSVEVYCWSSHKVVDEVQVGATKDEKQSIPVSIRLNFKVEKNKTAPPHKQGFYVLSLSNDPSTGYAMAEIMEHDYVFAAAVRFGIIDKIGNTLVCDLKEFKTQKALKEALRSDLAFYEGVKARVLARLQDRE